MEDCRAGRGFSGSVANEVARSLSLQGDKSWAKLFISASHSLLGGEWAPETEAPGEVSCHCPPPNPLAFALGLALVLLLALPWPLGFEFHLLFPYSLALGSGLALAWAWALGLAHVFRVCPRL